MDQTIVEDDNNKSFYKFEKIKRVKNHSQLLS